MSDIQLGFDFESEEPADPADPTEGSSISPESRAVPPWRETLPVTGESVASADVGARSSSQTASAPSLPRLIQSLGAVAERGPFRRKLLVCRTRSEGRELLRQLALKTGAWVGFEVTTVKPLAVEIAGPTLARTGLGIADDFDEQALVDEAVDGALLGRADAFAHLAAGVGFRKAIGNTLKAMRLGGLTPERLSRSEIEDRTKRDVLVALLEAYERGLKRRGVTDTAGVIARAVRLLEREGREALGDRGVHLVPGLGQRGLSGRFLRLLVQNGATVLEADPVRGLEAPDAILWKEGGEGGPLSGVHELAETMEEVGRVDVFAASSVTSELREVLRRVVSAGLRWDQVEIVTPDPQVYGSALHALVERLQIPVTFGVGLQVERTRPGRVAQAYFRWIEGGFQADVIRRLLEAGDLRPPPPDYHLHPMSLARRFRELRIGWGRHRYRTNLKRRKDSLAKLRAGRYETSEGLEKRRERIRRELRALERILAPTLRATPPVPDPSEMRNGMSVSPAQLAQGLTVFLRYTPTEDPVDSTAAERLQRILDRVAATLTRSADYRGAAALLKGFLQIRVPAPRAEGKAPWSSSGGHLHLTDLEHGGLSGREATFLVGLDADRFPGAGIQDPLLLDRERKVLARGDLPTGADRVEERRFLLAALLARLRGRVTVSYPAWDPSGARSLHPAPEVLQLFRVMERDQTRTFEDLRRSTAPVCGVVPRTLGLLDGLDVWMEALSLGDRLLLGVGAVRAAFPALGRGMRAEEALRGDRVTAHHGQVHPRPELDPRVTPDRLMSASALSNLGTCPRRFFLRHVLAVIPPDDPEFDPDRWLDPLSRGGLLHRVYERSLREARDEGIDPGSEAFVHLSLRILKEESWKTLDEVPTPSQEVHGREMSRLEDDVRAFGRMLRDEGAPWLELELRFGLGDSEPPVSLTVPGGTVNLRGAIDRIDAADDGLRVVDYKTGSPSIYGAERGVYDGGRRLQHVVYSVAAARLLGRKVEGMEYHFPTRRGENLRITFEERKLRTGPELVGVLLDGAAGGHFLPTDSGDDCKFCDYKEVCRARVNEWDSVDSPPAAWTREHLRDHDELRFIRRARGWDDEGEGLIEPLPLGTATYD
jgi:ATP-dependent helicase/nuclease subunit B